MFQNYSGFYSLSHMDILMAYQLQEKMKYELQEKKYKRKKYDINQIEIIRGVYNTNKTSKKDMCLFLDKTHEIKISLATFNKIINNTY